MLKHNLVLVNLQNQPESVREKFKNHLMVPVKQNQTTQLLDNHLFYDLVKPINKQIDAFVIVINCKNEYFPGIIKGFGKNGATVSIMVKSSYNWKWPLKKKEFFYTWDTIVGGISPPKILSKRGIFSVPELFNSVE